MAALLDLPDELLVSISLLLTNKDNKNLRLTSRRLNSVSLLSIERVFISPNHKNIEVFRALTKHREYCKRVKEIIWDDALLEKYVPEPGVEEYEIITDEGHKTYMVFEVVCQGNLDQAGGEEAFLRARSGLNPQSKEPPPVDLWPLKQSIDFYCRLYEEQTTIIDNGLDVAALQEGFEAFTALERVTVTLQAWRPAPCMPFFPTPMIRSLSPGFNYPTPCPGDPLEGLSEQLSEASWDDIRGHWHGFTAVLETLAHREGSVPEFVLDLHWDQVGVPHQFFDNSSEDLNCLESLCSRGLQRLDLAIDIFTTEGYPGLDALPQSLMAKTLSKATSMRRFALKTNSGTCNTYDDFSFDGVDDILRVIPLDSWPSLERLTLSTLPLLSPHFLAFLARLPKTIKMVELIDIELSDVTFKAFLETCKGELRWTAHNPILRIARPNGDSESRRLWVQDEIADYFDGGHNPFEGGMNGNQIQWGFGTITDNYDEEFSEPHIPDPVQFTFVSPGVYRSRTQADVEREMEQQPA